MKVIDSGMPKEKIWNQFFDVNLILSEIEINETVNNLVEIGCGYGTFTIPIANIIKGKIYTFDIDQNAINTTINKKLNGNFSNIIIKKRDVLLQSTAIDKSSVDYVCLFNILHHDKPNELFDEAYKILKPKGKVGIIHWRTDIETPRGPDLSIRPNAEKIKSIINQSFRNKFNTYIDEMIFEPYHWGIVLEKI